MGQQTDKTILRILSHFDTSVTDGRNFGTIMHVHTVTCGKKLLIIYTIKQLLLLLLGRVSESSEWSKRIKTDANRLTGHQDYEVQRMSTPVYTV